MADKLAIAKGVTTFVVGLSTGSVISAVVKNNVAPPQNVRQKVETEVGSYVVGAMVADVSKLWISRKFDDAVIWYKQNVETRDRNPQ